MRNTSAESLPPVFPGVADSATSIGSKDVQQDACFHVTLPGCRMVAVADGISSSPRSEYAAQLVLLSALGYIQAKVMDGKPMGDPLLRQAFTFAHEDARRFNGVLRHKDGQVSGTTMIIGVETVDHFFIASCGDGQAVFGYGELNYLNNYVYPQEKNGALYEYLGSSRETINPVITRIPKSTHSGGILFVMTDGAYTRNKAINECRTRVAEISRRVVAFETGTTIDVHRYLEEWVNGKSGFDKDDNRSVGLIISQEAIQYWKEYGPVG